MAASRATKTRKLTPKGPLVVSRMAAMSFGICSDGVRAMPSVPRPPALLTAATRGTEVLPAMPPSTIGCRIRSRSQTGVWIKGALPEVSGPVQFNAFVVTAAPACIVPSLHEVSSHFGQLRLKAVKVLLVRLDGVHLGLVAFSGSLEEHLKGEPGLAGLLGEGGRHLKLRARHMLEDDPLGFHDLDKDALVLIVDAIGAVHDEAPDATRPHVEVLKRVRKPLRPPPVPQVIRVGPRFEHELARRVEDARGDDLPVCERLSGAVLFCGHGF